MGIGTAMFRNKFLMDNVKRIYDFTANEQNTYPALVPEMTWYRHEAPASPTDMKVTNGNATTAISWSAGLTEIKSDAKMSHDTYFNIYASDMSPVDINDPRNIIAAKTNATRITVPRTDRTRYFAVTAIDRYGKESAPLQSCTDGESAEPLRPGLLRNEGNTVEMPPVPSNLDIEYILFESATGCNITVKKYQKTVDVANVPDGMYIMRSISKKGKSHRLGWLFIKRK